MLFNSKKSSTDGFFYSNQDFIAFSNFRSCLLEVYVQLDSKNSSQMSWELQFNISITELQSPLKYLAVRLLGVFSYSLEIRLNL